MINLRICIVGLGLMGGSLAKALKGQVKQVSGVDRHAATRQLALAEGVVDMVTADLSSAVKTADLLILSTPVHSILHYLEKLPELCPEGILVMDLGSTKEIVCTTMATLPASFAAIGGHPMCGKEIAGYQAAEAGLFQGQTFVLTRNGRTTAKIEEAALNLVKLIGAHPIFLEPGIHDQIVAVTSHLPYLISAVLIHRAVAMGDDRVWHVSASGFRDTARLAGSDPRMMLDILLTNRAAILSQLAKYQADLQEIGRLLTKTDVAALATWLADSQRSYNTYRKQKS
jgi:prephenate dehydrogenase